MRNVALTTALPRESALSVESSHNKNSEVKFTSLFSSLIQSLFAHLREQPFHRLQEQGVGGEVGVGA